MPDKDSPFWPFLRELLRVSSLLIFGGMIYSRFEADKDLLLIFLFALASGSITTVSELLSRKNAKDKDNQG